MSKKVLISGANGMLGKALIKKFEVNNWNVSGLVRDASFTSEKLIKLFLWHDNEEITEKYDLVIHLASSGATYTESNLSLYDTNMRLLTELFSRLKIPPKKFIYTGSCFEYEDGVNLNENSKILARSEYALSKINGWFFLQHYCFKNAVDVLGFRPFTIYGPNENPKRLIPVLLSGVENPEKELSLTSGTQSRDFIFVEDVAEAYLLASNELFEGKGEIFNLSTGRELKVVEVVDIIESVFKAKLNIKYGAEPTRKNEYIRLSGCSKKAFDLLGWENKTSLEEGLLKTFQWMKIKVL